MSVRIKGIGATKREINNAMRSKHRQFMAASRRISEDLLRKSRDNAPLQTGYLADSGSASVKDYGYGKGMQIQVGFDTPYAERMHEGRYQARQKMTEAERRRRYSGKDSTAERDLSTSRPSYSGLYGKRGRKFMTRALYSNRKRYSKAIERIAEA